MELKRYFTKGILISIWVIMSLLLSQNAFASGKFNLNATDTIAGYSALVKTSQIEPNTEVIFLLTRPDQSEILLDAMTNTAGIAELEVYGYSTKKAGLYTIEARRKTDPDYLAKTSFRVYADTLSSSQSTIMTDKTTASGDGEELIYLTVYLYDRYRNPIENHQVKLISSRSEDDVQFAWSSTSDEKGRVVFELSSKYPGISVYSAFDVNTGISLNDRVKVVYHEPVDDSSMGGNLLQTSYFAADLSGVIDTDWVSGPVKSFEITLPEKVPVNTAQTITVTARDRDKNVAKDYTGTILFATPDDENATLPSDNGEFTFTDTDRGEFTFTLALTFTKLGVQTIQVFDSEDWDIKWEKKITVVEADWTSGNNVEASGVLEIKTPSNGAKLSTTTVNIIGKASAEDQIKIFDNDLKIGETEADSDGIFTFEASGLSEGPHALYAKGSEDVSNTVNFIIDASPPIIDSFMLSPEGSIEWGSTYTITVRSEVNLSQTQIRINNVPEDLIESTQEQWKYTATLVAPENSGAYPIDVILTDELGNKGEYLKRGTLNVQKAADPLPPKVTGLRATSEENKVNLMWNAVTEHSAVISKYRIYYGTNEAELNQTVETNEAVTNWYIPNLINGQRYYFTITAVDNLSLESGEKSLVVNAIPKKKESLVRAVASDSKVTLSWQMFSQNPSRYKIKYGIQSGYYTESVVTFDNRTTWYIPDLLNNVAYYFQVAALDSYGNEQALAPEVSATPFGSGFKPVAPQQQNYILPQIHEPKGDTGPEVWIVIFTSLLFIDIILRVRKKLI